MDKTYQKFLKSGIDLAALGVGRGENETCFCTPRGASFIGWEGVDGIHYCFVRGYGGVVFAVSPENAAPDYVHAVARDFADFLRLLLSCGHGSAIEQCWQWNRGQFDAFLAENPPTDEARSVMDEIRETLALEPMDDAWGYIHELQAGFDYGRIKYSDPDTAAELSPETQEPWSVSYSCGYWGNSGREKPGVEIPVNAHFDYAGHEWRIPSAYSCAKGLVMDVAIATDAQAVHAFMARWYTGDEENRRGFTKAERMRIEHENPMHLDFYAELTLNGRKLRSDSSSSGGWAPIDGYDNEARALRWLEHYGLDRERCWLFWRVCFPWRRRTEIKSLSVTFTISPDDIPGESFTISGPGDTAQLTNPETGEVYTLTACEYGTDAIKQESFGGSDEYEYPTRLATMEYTLSPEAEGRAVSIHDIAEGEPPRRKVPDNNGGYRFMFVPNAACAVGVMLRPDRPGCHAAASALYFDLPERIEWLPVFRSVTPEPYTAQLI